MSRVTTTYQGDSIAEGFDAIRRAFAGVEPGDIAEFQASERYQLLFSEQLNDHFNPHEICHD